MDTLDNNGGEKKTKRPRIGAAPQAFNNDSNNTAAPERARFERVSYPRRDNDNGGAAEGDRPQRPYGYNRPQGDRPQRPYGYNRPQGDRPQRPYGQQRPYNNNYSSEPKVEGAEGTSEGAQQGGYQQRPYGYQQRQGGYNRQQGGYQQRQGGYNRPQGQRPYGQQGPRQQGDYQQRDGSQQGGYQQRQGGFNRQQGGYNRPQGQRPYGQQGGRQQGGYQQRQGGYGRPQGNRPQGNRQQGQQGGFFPQRGKSFTPRPKRIEYEMPIPDANEQIRLNKFMSNAGICSRREADEFIQQGLVKVNGQVVTELGTKITHSDVVEYDDKVLALESKCYILLNKPKDCVTTSEDPQDRTTVMDLVKGACTERIYPVGRLDRNTTGVLLLTNDGDLASKLTHPKYVKKKIYHVWVDKDITEEDMQRIADGIELEDGPIHADAISYATETDRNQAGIEIHSGRNRIVRRIFESLGYHVTKLDRVYFAGLTKKNLPRGRWRYLTQEEVNLLKMGAFE